MKIIVSVLSSLLFAAAARAQDCSGAFYFKEGQKVVYTKYGRGGKPAGRDVGTISAVTATNGKVSSRYELVKYDADDKVKEDGHAAVTCNGKELRIGFQVPEKNGSGAKEAYFSYPSDMRPGLSLEAKLEMQVKGETNGKKMDVSFKVQNRKVLGEESIRTPAGTFRAFKIGYDMEVRFKVVGIGIPMRLKVLEWFSPGLGVVKSESFNKDGVLEESSVLSAVN